MNKKIWGHTLVKNEDRWLWFSVSSVIDYVDRILLWDTGSTDKTLEIIKALKEKYPEKISIKERNISSAQEFTAARQEMLDETYSDWFIILDGDEIWFRDSIKKVIGEINSEDPKSESIVVPTINLVGDIFHYQPSSAGKYKFGNRTGHYNLRAVNRNIPGLFSSGIHGVWGWADEDEKQIQDRETFKFVEAPYFHATNLRRSSKDKDVIKRTKKFRHEIGREFPKNYFFPEALFTDRPDYIESPWKTMSGGYKIRAGFETPLRTIKRKFRAGKPGY